MVVEASVFNAWSWRTPALGGGHDQTTPGQGPDDSQAREVEAADDGGPGFSLDLTGYAVEAVDGEVGKVEKAGETDLVVDTGPWISAARSCCPPASSSGSTTGHARSTSTARGSRSRSAPEYAPAPDYGDRLARYYRDTYPRQ